jgi:hypothetical protein
MLPQFANASAGPVTSEHLKAEDNAGRALMYMRFEIVINLKDRKCIRDCVAAKLAGARPMS